MIRKMGNIDFDNICIVGAGAIGCAFGSFLSDAEYKVNFLEKDENIVKQIKEIGISVSGVKEIHCHNVSISSSPGGINQKQDLIFYAVKAYNLEEAVKNSLSMIGKDTYVICLQNGLGISEVVNKYIDKRQIIEGIVWFPAITIKPGHIQLLTFYEQSIFGGFYTPQEYISKLVLLLNSIGIPARSADDISYEIWRKAIPIIAGNSINALTRKHLGIISEIPELRESLMAVVQESLNIAKAEGINLKEEDLIRSMDNALEKGYEHKTSMLIDILNNRKTEVDFFNGKIIELGKKHHIQTPLNLLIYGLIKAIERSDLED